MEETGEEFLAEGQERYGGQDAVREARRHFSRLGGMFFLGTVAVFAVQIAVSILVQFLKPEWLYNADISLTISMVPMYLIGMPILILLVRRVPAETVQRHSIKAGHFVLGAMMCFALAYTANIAGLILTALIGMLKGSAVGNPIVNLMEPTSGWALILYVVICAPVMEEYVFRKLIVDREVRYGEGIAVVLSGLMFGLFHGNLNQFAYAFVIGVFLAFLYVKTGNLKVTIAIHMIINFMSGVVTMYLVKKIDLDRYMQVAADGDVNEMMAYMQDNMGGLALYGIYMLFIVGVTIAGVVLVIVNLVKKRFSFARGTAGIPKGKKFGTAVLNVGMILYVGLWLGMIIWQLVE